MEKYFLQPHLSLDERKRHRYAYFAQKGGSGQRTMTDFGLSSVKENLSVVSCNCHGFNNRLSYLPVLLDSFDVILLQEHWLSDSELTVF